MAYNQVVERSEKVYFVVESALINISVLGKSQFEIKVLYAIVYRRYKKNCKTTQTTIIVIN